MFCPNCRAINPDDGRYCVSCRAVLPALSGVATVGVSGGSPVTGPMPAAPGVAGVTLAGRYALLSLLGQGGMGLVYRARDLELEQVIAIKVLHPTLTADADALSRFKREVITARAITHPNVIRIHDFGVAPNSTPGIPGQAFISMELLPGGTLADRIAQGPIPLPEALSIAAALCEGLQAAHAQDVIHRDLKPQNALFDAQGTPKLVDFGIARLANATSSTQGFVGTPWYMSPEQGGTAEVTARSDLYSMGVLLFELFTGRVPFKGDSLISLALQHAKDPPPSPRTFRQDLPPLVETIVLKALAKAPADRPASAAEMAASLRGVPLPGPRVVPVAAAPPAATQEPPLTLRPPAQPVVLRRPRNRLAIVMMGLFLGTAIFFVLCFVVASFKSALSNARQGYAASTPFPAAVPTLSRIASTPVPSARPSPPPASGARTLRTGQGWSFDMPAGWIRQHNPANINPYSPLLITSKAVTDGSIYLWINPSQSAGSAKAALIAGTTIGTMILTPHGAVTTNGQTVAVDITTGISGLQIPGRMAAVPLHRGVVWVVAAWPPRALAEAGTRQAFEEVVASVRAD